LQEIGKYQSMSLGGRGIILKRGITKKGKRKKSKDERLKENIK
jgi:hypothetical protein